MSVRELGSPENSLGLALVGRQKGGRSDEGRWLVGWGWGRPGNGRSAQAPLCIEYLKDIEEVARNSERQWPHAFLEALTSDSHATRDQQSAKLGTEGELLHCKAAKGPAADRI